jgi:hypothetical protein
MVALGFIQFEDIIYCLKPQVREFTLFLKLAIMNDNNTWGNKLIIANV